MNLDYIFDTLAYPTSWAIPDDSSAMNFLRCLDNFDHGIFRKSVFGRICFVNKKNFGNIFYGRNALELIILNR